MSESIPALRPPLPRSVGRRGGRVAGRAGLGPSRSPRASGLPGVVCWAWPRRAVGLLGEGGGGGPGPALRRRWSVDDPRALSTFERLHFPLLRLPVVTANGDRVPITIEMGHPMEPDHHITRVTVVNERDPVPLKGVFELTPANGLAHLAFQAENRRGPLRGRGDRGVQSPRRLDQRRRGPRGGRGRRLLRPWALQGPERPHRDPPAAPPLAGSRADRARPVRRGAGGSAPRCGTRIAPAWSGGTAGSWQRRSRFTCGSSSCSTGTLA